jgi:hypothetical protein
MALFLASQAIAHCLKFNVAVRSQHTGIFRPPKIKQYCRGAKVFYARGYTDPDISPGPARELKYRYESEVYTILQRPHARAFLFMGGIVARVAKLFGKEDLMHQALQGPSIQTTVHHAGYTDIETELKYDQVSKWEVRRLLGFFEKEKKGDPDRSVFPSEALFKEFAPFQDEWNDYCEQWLQKVVTEISEDRIILRSPTDWIEHFRVFRRRNYDRDNNPPALAEPRWIEVRDQFRDNFHVSWDSVPLHSLQIPEPVPGNILFNYLRQ